MSTTVTVTHPPQTHSNDEDAIELVSSDVAYGKAGPTLTTFAVVDGNDLTENGAEAQEYQAEEFNEYWKLYLSHFFSAWGSRLFEFACAILIIDVYQNTLLPSSVYGFCITGTAILFSDAVGKWVDRTSRLRAVRILIFVEKISVILSSVGFWALLTVLFPGNLNQSATSKAIGDVVFTVIVILGCTYKLSTLGETIAISRDWVVIIADGKSEILTKLNTIMRRIDLLCQLFAPLFVALLTSVASSLVAVYVVGGWNILTLVLEYVLIYRVYKVVPTLARPKGKKGVPMEQVERVQRGVFKRIGEGLKQKWNDWLIYWNHPLFLATVSYSMLYLTVLSMGAGSIIAYLKTKHYSDFIIAAIRAVCVVTSLSGTFLLPFLVRRIGLVRTGMWFIWSEVISLAPVVVSFYLFAGEGTALNVVLFFGGISLSRIGLWGFDLAETQLVQEQVSNEQAGLINGLQFALCNVFDLLQFLATIVWSDPGMFYIPATISFASVAMAAVVFSWYGKRTRGHLFHFYKLLEKKD